ncbi:putative 28S ribosomal protein S25, mitochondrial, partial [Stegodyphus mimosarum]
MPYLLGSHAIRRTRQYLDQGKLIFRKNVQIMTVHFNDKDIYHQGAKDFVYWNLCQVQYKNPNVQVLFYKNMFPTSFVRCWLDTGEDVLMDVFGKTNLEILNHLIKILGQPVSSKAEVRKDTIEKDIEIAKFGSGYKRHCICEIPGQVPCPAVIPLPKHMTGKYKSEHNLWPLK